MNEIDMESVRHRPILCCTIAFLAASLGTFIIIDAAELQSAAAIVVRAQAPETYERPVLGIGFLLVAMAAMAPLILMLIAFWKHWSLAYYLAWIVAITLCVATISTAIAFVTYRFWRDHQRVAERLSVSDVICDIHAVGDHREPRADGRTSILPRPIRSHSSIRSRSRRTCSHSHHTPRPRET